MAMTKESAKPEVSRGSLKGEGNFLTLDVSDLHEDKVLQKVKSIIRNKLPASKRPVTNYIQQRESGPPDQNPYSTIRIGTSMPRGERRQNLDIFRKHSTS